MKKFEIAFENEDCNGEVYKVSTSGGFVCIDNIIHIADYYKHEIAGLRSFYTVRLKGEVYDLPTKCYNLKTVAETALTSYLLKIGVIENLTL